MGAHPLGAWQGSRLVLLPARRAMLPPWADYLDELKAPTTRHIAPCTSELRAHYTPSRCGASMLNASRCPFETL
jgi:hypothetical protein